MSDPRNTSKEQLLEERNMSKLKATFTFHESPDMILDQLKSFPDRYRHLRRSRI